MQSIRKRKMHTALFLVAISSQKKQVIFVFTVFLKRVRKTHGYVLGTSLMYIVD